MEIFVIVVMVVLTLPIASLVHEWGHYLGAKWQGIAVKRVQLGTGKPFFTWKQGSTEFQFNWNCFLGGYYIIENEQEYPKRKLLTVIASGTSLSLIFYFICFLLESILPANMNVYVSNWLYIFTVLNAYMAIIQLFPFRKSVTREQAGYPSDGLALVHLLRPRKSEK